MIPLLRLIRRELPLLVSVTFAISFPLSLRGGAGWGTIALLALFLSYTLVAYRLARDPADSVEDGHNNEDDKRHERYHKAS